MRLEEFSIIAVKRSDRQINHPGRKLNVQYTYYHCAAATPPSKGGETSLIIPFLKTSLDLVEMPLTYCLGGTGSSKGELNLEL